MPILNLRLTNLGPFTDIAFAFDEQVNVFVGPNNSGKTTALTALATITACLFELPAKLYRPTGAEFAVHFTGSRGDVTELRGALPIEPASVDSLAAWESMLKALGYTAFVPA